MKAIILYATDNKGVTKAWYFPCWDGQDIEWFVETLNKGLQVNNSILVIL